MSDQGPWVTKTILELEERVAELTEEIEHLQDSLIRQGKMLSAIVNITKGQPEGNALHSTHDAVESVERLQARVAELVYGLEGIAMCAFDYSPKSQTAAQAAVWMNGEAERLMVSQNSEAFILRKQAEAVEAIADGFKECGGAAKKLAMIFLNLRAKDLRDEAENLEVHYE